MKIEILAVHGLHKYKKIEEKALPDFHSAQIILLTDSPYI